MINPHSADSGGPWEAIRQWFAKYDDGEFALAPRPEPFAVIPPPAGSTCFLYTTKPRCVSALLSAAATDFPGGLIGRYGLPQDDELQWLWSWARGSRVFFLGDADPCDLLVFAALRSRWDLSFRGVGDGLLDRCGVSVRAPPVIPQSQAEVSALPLVAEVLPDWADLVGPRCAEVLRAGGKIEVELLLSGAAVSPGEVLRALVE